MKKITFLSMLFLASLTVITSCKKDDDDDHTTDADIQISAPVAGHEYNGGDTVFINASITNTVAMHGWELHVRKTADQTEVFTADAHDHAATYTIAEKWVNNVTDHSEMELEVIATIDHDGNTTNKKVTFHCMP